MNKKIFLTIFLSLAFAKAYATSFNTYHNSRFNYDIAFPSYLKPQGESANGDGQIIKNDRIKLIVWGSYMPEKMSEAYDNAISDLKNFKITYQHKDKNQFILSGESPTQIAYFKTIFICDENINFQLFYPKKDKSELDPIVKQISNSLKFSSSSCQ